MKRSRRAIPFEKIRVKKMGQKFCTLYHSGTWACEVRVRIHGIDTIITNGRKVRPTRIGQKLERLFDDLIQIESTGCDD